MMLGTVLAVTVALAPHGGYTAPKSACGHGYFATARIEGARWHWNADRDRRIYPVRGGRVVWDGVRIVNRSEHRVVVRFGCR